jgi:dolichyl-phosphate-mannose--protein O-mannosyl transferase
MDVTTTIIALATALTAIFSGIHMWYTFDARRVRVLPKKDGSFVVENPATAKHTVRIEWLLAADNCSLWSKKRNHFEWGDHGEMEIMCNIFLAPGEQNHFLESIVKDRVRCLVIGKVKYARFFRPEHVNIFLFPGDPLSQLSPPRY